MKLQSIYSFFEQPQVPYIGKQLATCYVLSKLIKADSYATELINQLQAEYPLRLSDTVL